jgi:sensor histidine kinase YesM
VDNVEEIDVLKISRRFLFYYYPVWFFYSILFSFLSLTKLESGFLGFFIVTIIVTMFFPLIMYLSIIVPVILFRPKKSFSRRMVMLLSSLLFSSLIIIVYINFLSPMYYPTLNPVFVLRERIVIGQSVLIIGLIICWLFSIEEKQFITENRIISERNKKLENEKMIIETHLRLLQAQIEPHFLFNTLTSILSLSNKNPQKAKIMHNNFMQYLKITLSKTRSSVTTIGQEIELIKAYLDIFKVRMGKRLHYFVEADDEVCVLPFPSMLIQPIVENAIKHGLEPKIEGGEIRIKVTKKKKNRLCWEIKDTGLGMSEKSHLGTGLSNIMERIEALYGKEGSFTLKENQPSGVKVILEVPHV